MSFIKYLFFVYVKIISSLIQCISPYCFKVEKLTEALLCREETKLRDMLYGPAPPTVAYNVEVCTYPQYYVKWVIRWRVIGYSACRVQLQQNRSFVIANL